MTQNTPTPTHASVRRALGFAAWWRRCNAWYRLLEPARACLLASLVVPVLFVFVPQGTDLLRRIASEHLFRWHGWYLFSRHGWFMFLGVIVAGGVSWAWARFLLNCPPHRDLAELSASDAAETARAWLATVCGLVAPLGLAVGFFCAAPGSGEVSTCRLEGLLCLLIGVVTCLLQELAWQRVPPRFRGSSLGVDPVQGATSRHRRRRRYERLADIRADHVSILVIVFSWLVSVVVFVELTWQPVELGEYYGSTAVLLFAVAFWISVGSVVVYFSDRLRFPILTFLLLWACFCSLLNDNHHVRRLTSSVPASPALKLPAALVAWHEAVVKAAPLPDQARRPMYLVASAGGGIRAAYWTAAVLGELESRSRTNGASFASHTFLVSGVSGGSLGELAFLGLVHQTQPSARTFRQDARRFLGRDFLAADLARMVYGDLLQRFLPFPWGGFDRAAALEDAWASGWQRSFGNDLFGSPTSALFDGVGLRVVSMPHFVLNGTLVETGQRVVTSDLEFYPNRPEAERNPQGRFEIGTNLLDVVLADKKLEYHAIRISTAAHQSARFTYFSPAGRFPDGTHIVDGGYFENSGSATLMDAIRLLKKQIHRHPEWNVDLRVILINNDPIKLQPVVPNLRFMGETLPPVWTLLNTRDARGTYAVENTFADLSITNGFEFNLFERPDSKAHPARAIPLGWTLSEAAMDEMDFQLDTPFETRPPQRVINSATVETILADLPKLGSK